MSPKSNLFTISCTSSLSVSATTFFAFFNFNDPSVLLGELDSPLFVPAEPGHCFALVTISANVLVTAGRMPIP